MEQETLLVLFADVVVQILRKSKLTVELSKREVKEVSVMLAFPLKL